MMHPLAAGLCMGLLVAFMCGPSAAEPELKPAEPAAGPAKAAEMPLVFDEDMATPPFNRFKSLGPGGGEWKANTHWIIKAPAGYVQPVKAGRDVQLTVRMSFPRLVEGETSETRLGLVYYNNQVGVVVLSRKREGEKTLGQILVARQPDIVGPIAVPLRMLELKDDLPSGTWVFQVRAGALTLTCDGKEIGRGCFESRVTPIVGVAIVQPAGSLTVQRMTLRGISFPAEPSGQQREQALAASALNNEAGSLLRSKRYTEALEKARQVVPMYKKLYGQDHPDVANALSNLAEILKRAGEIAEPAKVLEEALAVRQRLFGPDHPDTALIEMELTTLLVQLNQLEAAFPHCLSAHFSFSHYYGDDNRSTILTRQMLDKLPRPKNKDEI